MIQEEFAPEGQAGGTVGRQADLGMLHLPGKRIGVVRDPDLLSSVGMHQDDLMTGCPAVAVPERIERIGAFHPGRVADFRQGNGQHDVIHLLQGCVSGQKVGAAAVDDGVVRCNADGGQHGAEIIGQALAVTEPHPVHFGCCHRLQTADAELEADVAGRVAQIPVEYLQLLQIRRTVPAHLLQLCDLLRVQLLPPFLQLGQPAADFLPVRLGAAVAAVVDGDGGCIDIRDQLEDGGHGLFFRIAPKVFESPAMPLPAVLRFAGIVHPAGEVFDGKTIGDVHGIAGLGHADLFVRHGEEGGEGRDAVAICDFIGIVDQQRTGAVRQVAPAGAVIRQPFAERIVNEVLLLELDYFSAPERGDFSAEGSEPAEAVRIDEERRRGTALGIRHHDGLVHRPLARGGRSQQERLAVGQDLGIRREAILRPERQERGDQQPQCQQETPDHCFFSTTVFL